MSSTDGSDDEFESADEEIDLNESRGSALHLTDDVLKSSTQSDDNIQRTSDIRQTNASIGDTKTNQLVCHSVDKKVVAPESGSNESGINSEKTIIDETVGHKSDANEPKEDKVVIKGRKIVRKANRNTSEVTHEESQPEDTAWEDTDLMSTLSDLKISPDDEEKSVLPEPQKIESIDCDIKLEKSKSDERVVDKINVSEPEEEKVVIKGRKIERKAKRSSDTTHETPESEVTAWEDSDLMSTLSDMKDKETTSVLPKPQKVESIDCKMKLEKSKSDERVVDKINANEPEEEKVVIKDRKIERKAKRSSDTTHEETELEVTAWEDSDLMSTLSDLKIVSDEDKKNVLPEPQKIDAIDCDIKLEKSKSDETVVDRSDEKESKVEKTVIKGRKITRKVDKSSDKIRDKLVVREEETDLWNTLSESSSDLKKSLVKEKDNQSKEMSKNESIKSDVKLRTEESNEMVVEISDEKSSRDHKNIIKGRKLVRKADRMVDTYEESQVSEEKKMEVLGKLGEVKPANQWNWFSDITSAAKTATSTTVNHMSSASNKWSFDPKSLLSSAATITSQVGTGLNSIVENVSSVVDTAIGAPPPEHMAALVTQRADNETNTRLGSSSQQSSSVTNETSSESGFRSLFDSLGGRKTTDVSLPNVNDYDKRK